eukprot:3922777-Pyramimonas_sp.AAC.1
MSGLPPHLAREMCGGCPPNVLRDAHVALSKHFHIDAADPTCDGMLPDMGTSDYALANMEVRQAPCVRMRMRVRVRVRMRMRVRVRVRMRVKPSCARSGQQRPATAVIMSEPTDYN